MRTQTRDTSVYGLSYVSGLLRMKGSRTMADVAREAALAEQNMQHFMSNSPWSGCRLLEQVQNAIGERRELQGGMLVLDESADEKSGDSTTDEWVKSMNVRSVYIWLTSTGSTGRSGMGACSFPKSGSAPMPLGGGKKPG